MKKLTFAMLVFVSVALSSAEIFVDYGRGRAANPGTEQKPFGSLQQALKVVKPGDVIKIKPSDKPISNIILIQNVCGEEGKPIVIDCMNNIFTGEKTLKDTEWAEASTGLYKCTKSQFSHDANRYYMIHKGRIVRMGRFTKSKKSAAFKAVDALQPGEWTVVDPEPKNKQKHNIDYYVKVAEGEKDLGNWSEPGRACGVAIKSVCTPETCGGRTGSKGDCTNKHCNFITVKNVVVTHYLNDGFNIHGNCKGIRFENVAAVECGDDGLSAHNNTEVYTENFVSIRNSTAICHIQDAKTVQKSVYCEGTLGVDFFPCNSTDTTLVDAFILGDSADGINVNNNKGGNCIMKNVVCASRNPQASFICPASKNLTSKVTFENVQINGYAYPKKIAGVSEESQQSVLLDKCEAKRKELFALFGGALGKLGL